MVLAYPGCPGKRPLNWCLFCIVTCIVSVYQGGPGVGPTGQGGLHAASGPGSSGDKAVHVRRNARHFLSSIMTVGF